MAKVVGRPDRYPRDPALLARDITKLLVMRGKGELMEMVVRQVVRGALWWVGDAFGKKDACELWSAAAFQQWHAQKRPWKEAEFVHEHLVPRALLEEAIVGLKNEPQEDEVAMLLRLSRHCIVTKGEDDRLNDAGLRQRMPEGVQLWDIQARYKHVGIALEAQSQSRLDALQSTINSLLAAKSRPVFSPTSMALTDGCSALTTLGDHR